MQRELLEQACLYLERTLGEPVHPRAILSPPGLPYHLLEQYDYVDVTIAGFDVVLMLQKHPADGIKEVRKHIEFAGRALARPAIVVLPRITPWERRTLTSNRTSFIVPGSQLYAPLLIMDLRERFPAPAETSLQMSPSTQALFLRALYEWPKEMTFRWGHIAADLGYTPMTHSRATRELVRFGLCTASKVGREQHLQFVGTKRDVWDNARSALRTPVLRTIPLCGRPVMTVQAGLTALAAKSLVQAPLIDVIALSKDELSANIQGGAVCQADDPTGADCLCQVWSYPPALIHPDPHSVDTLSLYLSLRDSDDERTQIAIEQLIEEFPWL